MHAGGTPAAQAADAGRLSRLAARQPGTSFYSVKRFIGQQHGRATLAEARQASMSLLWAGLSCVPLAMRPAREPQTARRWRLRSTRARKGTPASPAPRLSKVHSLLLRCACAARAQPAHPSQACSGRLYPEEVSAEVLKVLLATAAEAAGRPITKAVISVRR